ncbi:MAG: cation:proton antiporter [Syntrophales bacterium]|nr:cation:proton antiporter [Syntrophales bacterium]
MQQSVLFNAILLLAAALIFVPLAKRLYLGSILGYLVAGVAIGPYGIGLIGKEGPVLMHFAELGIVLMLFLIGLELEPTGLRRLRTFIFSAGLFQYIATAAAVGLFFLLAGFSWPASTAIGLAISMSSTALVLQMMKEKGLTRLQAGEAALAVLLTQDIAVIPVLALLPLLAMRTLEQGNWFISTLPGWLQTMVIFGAIGLVWLSGRYVLVPFLRFIARSNLRELLTAAALFIVLSTAFFMSELGISPALGTFLAGVVLAGSEFRHQLESDIEPFKGILVGLFFISVGAGIDFSRLALLPWKIGATFLIVVVIKGLILYTTGYVARLTKEERIIFTVSLSQVGEFSFLLFTFMDRLSLISSPWTDTFIFITAVSMMLTPLLMLVVERFVLPTFLSVEGEGKKSDVVYQSNPVVIAGFGPFGSIVGRFLRANGVEATILDNNPDRVALLRKMGFKAYFGDATRLEVLKSAGIEEAKILVAAIGEWAINADLIEKAKKAFPHLVILARVAHPVQAYELMAQGEEHIYRETLDTSVRMGVDCLVKLGYRRYSAYRAGQKFLKYDEEALKVLFRTREDEEAHILTAREMIEIQEKLLMRDRLYNPSLYDHAWDSTVRGRDE